MARDYLKEQTYRSAFIDLAPREDLAISVVIPCFKEPNLRATLDSLLACDATNGSVEVIVIINESEKVDPTDAAQNQITFEEAITWVEKNNSDRLRFFIHYEKSLPKKHAGVGLARKIGMDEALRRFKSIDKTNGVILCYDADSSCLPNYLKSVEQHFTANPNTNGCSIHFEHPIEGDVYSSEVYEAILQYELHLRYYRQALWFAGHPYGYHTIGSSMAVRANAYEKQGGMNRRKAGEDFYFLQKIIQLGNFTEMVNTKVIPSPRPSDRVPFGTGKAVNDKLSSEIELVDTYHPQLFVELKVLFDNPFVLLEPEEKIDLPKSVLEFLKTIQYRSAVAEIRKNTTDDEAFKKRFFNWFNAFTALKYVHYGRDHFYPNIGVDEASNVLLKLVGWEEQDSLKKLLDAYRKLDIGTANS